MEAACSLKVKAIYYYTRRGHAPQLSSLSFSNQTGLNIKFKLVRTFCWKNNQGWGWGGLWPQTEYEAKRRLAKFKLKSKDLTLSSGADVTRSHMMRRPESEIPNFELLTLSYSPTHSPPLKWLHLLFLESAPLLLPFSEGRLWRKACLLAKEPQNNGLRVASEQKWIAKKQSPSWVSSQYPSYRYEKPLYLARW